LNYLSASMRKDMKDRDNEEKEKAFSFFHGTSAKSPGRERERQRDEDSTTEDEVEIEGSQEERDSQPPLNSLFDWEESPPPSPGLRSFQDSSSMYGRSLSRDSFSRLSQPALLGSLKGQTLSYRNVDDVDVTDEDIEENSHTRGIKDWAQEAGDASFDSRETTLTKKRSAVPLSSSPLELRKNQPRSPAEEVLYFVSFHIGN